MIFTPPPESIISRRRVIDHYNHAPLFICLRTVISSSECQDKELLIQDTFNKDGIASLCLSELQEGVEHIGEGVGEGKDN